MKNNLHSDVLVIGGGLSGMLFAYFAAKRGKTVTVLEASPSLGGCICTVTPYEGHSFFLELGAHTIYSSYGTILSVVTDLGLKPNIIPHKKAGYMMCKDNAICSLFSQVDLKEAVMSIPAIFRHRKNGLSVKEYYTKVFGENNYKNLIHPMTSAVICQDTDNVAAELLLKRRPKDKSFPRAFTFMDGLSEIPNSISALGNVSVHTETTAVSAIHDGETYSITVADGRVFTAGKIAVATPAPVSAKILSAWQPELSKMLSSLPMHKSIAYGLSARSGDVGIRRFAYIIANGCDYRSVVSRDVYEDKVFRGATFHFKAGAGIDGALPVMRETMKINPSSEIYAKHTEFSLPELKVGHNKFRRELEEKVNAMPDFALLGNFFGGLSMEDCAIRAKEEASRIL